MCDPVSVGIMAHDRPDTLRRTIEDITGQSYWKLEIILSNNGSTDKRVDKVCREYAAKDKRITYYNHGGDRNGFFNINFTLEKAQGKYFMWAADDDGWDRKYIEKMVGLHQQYPDAVLATSHSRIYDMYNGEYPLKEMPRWINKSQYHAAMFLLLSHPWNRARTNMQYGLFKTDFLKTLQPIWPELREEAGWFFWDWVFLVEVAMKGRIVNTPEKLFYKYERTPLSMHSLNMVAPLSPFRYLKYKMGLPTLPNHGWTDTVMGITEKYIRSSDFPEWQKRKLLLAHKVSWLRFHLLF